MQLDPPKGLQSLSFVSFSLENLDLPKDVRFIILSQINSFSGATRFHCSSFLFFVSFFISHVCIGVVYPDKCNFLFSFCAKGNEPFSTIRNIKVRDGKVEIFCFVRSFSSFLCSIFFFIILFCF